MKKLVLLSSMAVAVFARATGCATETRTFNSDMPKYAQIEVITEPAGARTTVDGNYVGEAPMTVTLNNPEWGVTIEAIPNLGGEYVQSHMIGTAVPSRIFFNMYLHQMQPGIPPD